MIVRKFYCWFLFVFLIVSSCAPTPEECMAGGDRTVQVSWDATHAFEVSHVPGGGHKVYYSAIRGLTENTASVIDVPYSQSATSAVIGGLKPGCTYYVRVKAYSALNPSGSPLSGERSILVP